MRIDGGIAGGSRQILSIAVWDMLSSLRVSKALSQAKIDDIDVVLLLADADQEVVRLDVSMQEVPRVHELNSLQLSNSHIRKCQRLDA